MATGTGSTAITRRGALLERPAGRGAENIDSRSALITGVSGQDGALLARLLIEKGYEVTGSVRSLVSSSLWRLEELGIRSHARLRIIELDVADAAGCLEAVGGARPGEVYNLSGVSFIGLSFSDPLGAARVTGLGAWNLLEAIRCRHPKARFFQASSSEMFGSPEISPQDEETRFNPRSPYAISKAFAHWATANYRNDLGVFASSGILYNHESPLRGNEFVTRKITSAAARISRGQQEFLELGNLDARRDWGYAPEYVDGMWRILQSHTPDSFVLATGRLTTVRRFVDAAFKAVRMGLIWQGAGLDETGIENATGKIRVKVSPQFFRPAEAHPLCGNPGKSRLLLDWKAGKEVEEICRIMVNADLKRLDSGRML